MRTTRSTRSTGRKATESLLRLSMSTPATETKVMVPSNTFQLLLQYVFGPTAMILRMRTQGVGIGGPD